MTRALLLLVCILCLSLFGCATRTAASKDLDAATSGGLDLGPIRQRIAAALEAQELASLSVAVAVDGEVVWEEAFGLADRDEGIRATPETVYPIASLSKPITATALMILADRGKVSLGEPVNSYLRPGGLRSFGGVEEAVTVRHLLQHRSGLGSHGRYFFENEPAEPPPIEESIRRYGIITTPPNSRYEYSNLGFGVLAYLTSRVSGRPYPDFVRDELFRPLGMTSSSVQIDRLPTVRAAELYDPAGEPIPYYRFDEWGSGRVFSTAGDLLRFGMYHLGQLRDAPPILREETRRAMVLDRATTGRKEGRYGTDWFYALGWGGREKTEYSPYWYGHDGAMPGISADMKLLPEQKAVIVVLSNSRSSLPSEVTTAVMDLLVPGYRESRARDPAFANTPQPQPQPPDAALVGSWSGSLHLWTGAVPLQLRIAPTGIAFLSINGGREVQLAETWFEPGKVSGTAAIAVPLPEAASIPHSAKISLDLRGSALEGTIHAMGEPPLYRFQLPSWAELKREPGG